VDRGRYEEGLEADLAFEVSEIVKSDGANARAARSSISEPVQTTKFPVVANYNDFEPGYGIT
jgi:hypothetical protein